MIFIGDYFAIGMVVILSLFFFDDKYYLTRASRYFVGCLIMTAIMICISNVVMDLLYAVVDPRIKLTGGKSK